ncbi:sugar ABC transporter ATP-binding protein [Kaistia algarum]|uniref:sugar ABC transporter ATP-binding protein n=1 Tax=Kaistia algarum TaxID=2083279 RepID=UPI000CE8B4FE|nr:sugar ABC transporter ATP-binding protein [Kaistia algarum]MCX5515796.1 sugar ABC transporter ATP-binding protein [Kaistia algarum]PPE80830.1 sugar ABC transporter ATP-binding protein [Kaistia algarum]
MTASLPSSPPALEIVGLGKRFPGVVALADVSLRIDAGSVHGLVGQNGAGKSTLINILSGMYAADEGVVRLAGQPVEITDTRRALGLGIATVYQELSLLPNLTIAENLSLGREPRRRGILDRPAMIAGTRQALDRLGLALDPLAIVGNLSLAEKQMVEIAKALATDPRILVLDEPTAPLGAHESGILFAAIARLKAQGVAILYVSHRFAEVLALCDTATVLRNGRHVVTAPLTGWTESRLTDAMIGSRTERFEHKARQPGEVAVALQGITFGHQLRGIDLVARRGEIVGVTGLLGAGQNELGRLIGGDIVADGGEMVVGGRPRRFRGPADAVKAGVCLLTEERKAEGILPNLTLRENIGVSSLRDRRGPLGLVRTGAEQQATEAAAATFGVVAASMETPIRRLSGGNQQKALVARWHLANVDIFVLIEPTRGVDVGARTEIYRRLDELARAGKAIIVVSSELAEVLALADRILVVRAGRIDVVVDPASVDEEVLNLVVQGAEAA